MAGLKSQNRLKQKSKLQRCLKKKKDNFMVGIN